MNQLHKKALTTAKRVLCVCLAASLLSCVVPAGTGYEVAAKRDPMFKLSAAKTVAVSKSDNLESLEIQVSSKQAAMQSAVKSLKEKERNMATTRWSPLLNIKFP
ncbi:MAG: hypothetical protein IJT32_03080, partial [Lachnospiraceae bacterium]|nr:hypothetical protein [Lachnospiraceae bacterium]